MDLYDNELDRLREHMAALEQENRQLRALLREHGITPPPLESTPAILPPAGLTAVHAKLLYATFRGRKDVYSRRAVLKDGRSAYFPVCQNFWTPGLCPKRDGKKQKCMDCLHRDWAPLTQRALLAHLRGDKENCSDVVGIYPLLPDETCNFLVFDFDHHESDSPSADSESVNWKAEVDAMREICSILQVPCLVERSRSGNGAHVWILFQEPVSAELARSFGACLLTKGAEYVSQKSFVSYDRMLPAQDHMPKGGLGNLIALPLQGRALRSGNSAFLDEQWKPYPDQWSILRQAKRVSISFLKDCIEAWSSSGILGPLSSPTVPEVSENVTKPWKQRSPFKLEPDDVRGPLCLVRADQIYIKADSLKPRLQNQLRRMASFQNPNYYKTLAMGYSVRNIPRIITCSRDIDSYLALPRGLWESLTELLTQAGIPYDTIDERQQGRSIDVDFNGTLYPEQQLAAENMLCHDIGILSAATAFGKTAVGSWLIAQRKVNTLILVHNREIMKNWVEDLSKFLVIREECPEYTTAKGRQKRRPSVIGTRYAAHDSTTGILDVVMVTSLGKPGEIAPLVKQYGMVLMDECHHGAAHTIEEVLREVSARYVYGLTATPKRDDGMEQKVLMQFGAIRHRFTAKEKAALQGIAHSVVPRFTRLVDLGRSWTINEAYQQLIHSQIRNQQLVEDTRRCLSQGRTPLILTKFKEHAQLLRSMLEDTVPNLFVLQGGKSTRERDSLRAAIRAVDPAQPVVLIAIGKYIGEGFNFPRLDTLLLAAPIAWEGNLEQYAGRLHRDYADKSDTVIYDYVDCHVPVLEKMYHKRVRAYKKIGYTVGTPTSASTCGKNQICDAQTYLDPWLEDLCSVQKELLISSPGLSLRFVKQFIELIAPCQEKGTSITVLTLEPDGLPDAMQETYRSAIFLLESVGAAVRTIPSLYGHFAVIDENVAWYGNINLLSHPKQDENMLRIADHGLAAELRRLAAELYSGANQCTL